MCTPDLCWTNIPIVEYLFVFSQMKPWGDKEFWGLGEDFDPDWVLTEAQKELRSTLMEVCRTKIRPQAVSLGTGLWDLSCFPFIKHFNVTIHSDVTLIE